MKILFDACIIYMSNSFYNINGINSFYPSGSVLAYIGGVTDPNGWVNADGVARNNSDGKYNNLISLGIGTSIGGYTPPNLQAAFLRGSGNNGNYTGPTIMQGQTAAIHNHTHTMHETAHTHTLYPNPTDESYVSPNTKYGLAKVAGSTTTSGTRSGSSDNSTSQINQNTTAGLAILETTTATTLTSVGDNETAPYHFGVKWIIKL